MLYYISDPDQYGVSSVSTDMSSKVRETYHTLIKKYQETSCPKFSVEKSITNGPAWRADHNYLDMMKAQYSALRIYIPIGNEELSIRILRRILKVYKMKDLDKLTLSSYNWLGFSRRVDRAAHDIYKCINIRTLCVNIKYAKGGYIGQQEYLPHLLDLKAGTIQDLCLYFDGRYDSFRKRQNNFTRMLISLPSSLIKLQLYLRHKRLLFSIITKLKRVLQKNLNSLTQLNIKFFKCHTTETQLKVFGSIFNRLPGSLKYFKLEIIELVGFMLNDLAIFKDDILKALSHNRNGFKFINFSIDKPLECCLSLELI